MDKKIVNKLIMLKAVLGLLKKNENLGMNSSNLVAAYAELENLLNQIEQIQKVTGDSDSGLVNEKDTQKEALINKAFEIASLLFAMATRTKNNVLLAKVDFPISVLQNLRDTELPQNCTKIADLGRSSLTATPDSGITDTELSILDNLIIQYKFSLPAHRVSVSGRKAANLTLKEMVKTANKLVTDQIDRLMVPFKANMPEFYASYLNARKVVDYGTRYDKPEDPAKPE